MYLCLFVCFRRANLCTKICVCCVREMWTTFTKCAFADQMATFMFMDEEREREICMIFVLVFGCCCWCSFSSSFLLSFIQHVRLKTTDEMLQFEWELMYTWTTEGHERTQEQDAYGLQYHVLGHFACVPTILFLQTFS